MLNESSYLFFYKQQVYKVTNTDYFEVLTPQMFVHVDWFIGWFLFYLQKTTDNTMSATKFTPFTLLDHSPGTRLCCLCSSLLTHRPLTMAGLGFIFSGLFLQNVKKSLRTFKNLQPKQKSTFG